MKILNPSRFPCMPLTINVPHQIETSQLICIWLVSIWWGTLVINGVFTNTLSFPFIYPSLYKLWLLIFLFTLSMSIPVSTFVPTFVPTSIPSLIQPPYQLIFLSIPTHRSSLWFIPSFQHMSPPLSHHQFYLPYSLFWSQISHYSFAIWPRDW